LVLAIELENQKSLATELLKPFTIGHPAVLEGCFADVGDTWTWDPHVITFPSLFFFLFLFFPMLLKSYPRRHQLPSSL
jgi:hypothetical protein